MDEVLNIVQIEQKIADDLKSIRNNDDLRALQKWAKSAKKKKVIEPTVTSFKQMYYTWYTKIRSGGSGKACGERFNSCDLYIIRVFRVRNKPTTGERN